MIANPTTVFMSVKAQHDNLGDIEIRRTALSWLQEARIPVVLLIGRMPRGYIEALGIRAGSKLHRSSFSFQIELIRRGLAGKASIMFAPGPQVMQRGFKPVLKTVLNLVNVSLVRAGGGKAIAVGRSVRGDAHRKINRSLIRRFDLYSVRDGVSGKAVGLPLRTCPDLGLWETHEISSKDRTVAISLRSDRPIDETSFGAIIKMARDSGFEPVLVSQVHRDDHQHAYLAHKFRLRALLWERRSHVAQFDRVTALYESAEIVISNRLHALILGIQQSAVPVLLLDSESDKLTSTILPWFDAPIVSLASTIPETVDALLGYRAISAIRKDLSISATACRRSLESLRDEVVSKLGS